MLILEEVYYSNKPYRGVVVVVKQPAATYEYTAHVTQIPYKVSLS
jgi:hypothetical protein